MVLSAALAAGITAAGSMAGSALSNAQSYSQSKKLMDRQAKLNYIYSKKTALESPGWNRQGLEDAGYNPMLAVQNATSGVNSNWAGLNNSTVSDYGSSVGAGISNAMDIQRVDNETKTADSAQDLNYANADKAKAEKSALMEKMPFISQREKAEIGNIDKDSMLKESQIHNIDETTKFIQKRYELDKMLGLMGINVQRYGIDKNYASSIYNADSLAETQRGIVDMHYPFGVGGRRYYSPKQRDKMFYHSY